MQHFGLPLRRRARKLAGHYAGRTVQLIGGHPYAAGFAGTLIALAMAGLIGSILYLGRSDALDRARDAAASLVAIMTGDLERNIETYNLSLQGVVESAQRPGIWELPPDLRQSLLFDRFTTASYVSGAYVVDANGAVVASQSRLIDRTVRLSDRDYFLVHQRSPSVGLYVSHPYRSRLRGGLLSIGLTRRINAQDGSFDGVALMAVPVDFFQRLVDRINTGRAGSAFIALSDGTWLARKPLVHHDVSASHPRLPAFAVMATHVPGSYVARSRVDGVERIFTFARVPGSPLIAVVAPAVDDVLADWRERSIVVGGLTSALVGLFILLSWLLAFTLRDRVRTQIELERLAVTDGLTGLSNRRALDTRLEQEWARARRGGTPLAVLFIDVDHFKRFNDTYGHAAGDEVLAAVAECIGSCARRPADMPARYGGEEFAMVLPELTAEQAATVGERVRRKIQALRVAHEGSAHGEVTVSVGAASCMPAAGGGVEDLLRVADALLYEAKAAGRNRVHSATAAQAVAGVP
ncbi:sensor domain-containing diguanylate cyclase [Bordetella genomosp. 13]|uniref:sensor domain-containing diguanylate cyclase n=1 Tax=Bordetella genomosp. 13 TaxID=463040 RepID=UPI0011A84F8E|nr:sensor domain-containing diguanylate cyclase [Bordetella genomosp. 13]